MIRTPAGHRPRPSRAAALLSVTVCLAAGCSSPPSRPQGPDAAGGGSPARSAQATTPPRDDAELAALRAELLERRRRDQEIRSQDLAAMSAEERSEAFARFRQIDRENTAWLQEVVARHGWPTIDQVGPEAADAAWLLLQHADHDPEFQARMLPVLEAAAERGEVDPSNVAYLTDRVRVKQRRPQLYGTQYHARTGPDGSVQLDDDGTVIYLLPVVEDVDALDARRRAAGLPPWREYEALVADMQGREPADAPRAWNGAVPVDPQTHP